MRNIRVLTVCGSGTVTSSMLSHKITDQLQELGYRVIADEVNPGGVRSAVSSNKYDLIAYVSPINQDDCGTVPVIAAMQFLTGMDEESFIEKVKEILEK